MELSRKPQHKKLKSLAISVRDRGRFVMCARRIQLLPADG
jgi:hypothetical protein